MSVPGPAPHSTVEPHDSSVGGRLNWLRAAVLGANDGLLSTAGLVLGVAAATTDRPAILVAGMAGLVAGASSMAIGEYVSVSTQRDTEKALIEKETRELEEAPEAEFDELVGLYTAKGLSEETARRVAEELHADDPLAAHLDAELGIDAESLTNPVTASISSAISFALGAVIPLLAVLAPATLRVPLIGVLTVVGLILAGYVSARLGDADPRPAVRRLVIGGVAAMTVTYGIGLLLGTSVA
ncbi:Predicted Fe2+/Mn2+ transporter, VIT1/CCC1 family [Dietzia kunjamensis subsp. schimae]|uniref:Predicted Fe2+/Mn2+ transporter, VIT1/CCC1 family n=1 Tax=Dietzia kunjamensis subsp. schimae TaxID=498198 RepID=A0ABY1MZ50_9ACTN|nr:MULTISPECIES: VIT family protein [Dietzia]MBB1016065.1 VIT family protein [Dietzia kunjamensis subsp. schimae]MCT1432949.1 VIT family protein [Dietzia maris]MCT1520053.1 VIT family protein [Dietzia maris]MEB8325454.1 VIT family protein [Dietzia kunjamensis]SMO57168.1 Predicted Fe2+/Mn2+ transporter, VIT1/CCC1 family [Dietzia kunjamensis subsp. schimae]